MVIKQLLNNKEARNKLLVTLLVVLAYVAGRAIRSPGFDGTIIDVLNNSFLNYLSLMGGGIMEQMSILALGISPFINASIVIQLLSMDVIKPLEELRKDGKKGERKLEYITFCLGLVLSLVQGYFLARSLGQYVIDNTVKGYIFIAAILTIGSCLAYGLGKIIDKWGMGSGTSMIIFAGIISSLPQTIRSMYSTMSKGWFIAYIIAYILIAAAVVAVQMAERKIPIQYSKSVNTTRGDFNHLPLKINSSSVIPVIFASSIIQVPQIITSWISYEKYTKLSQALSFSNWYMILIYGLLIIAMAFFYTNLQIEPSKLAANLSKQNGFIPGVRPGKETERYISRVLNSITALGSFLLMLLALLPFVLAKLAGRSISLGGTGIIIVVGVAMDLLKEINTAAISGRYKTLASGGKKRVR